MEKAKRSTKEFCFMVVIYSARLITWVENQNSKVKRCTSWIHRYMSYYYIISDTATYPVSVFRDHCLQKRYLVLVYLQPYTALVQVGTVR